MFADYATADRGSTNYDVTNHMPQQSTVKSNVAQCCSVFYNLQSHSEKKLSKGQTLPLSSTRGYEMVFLLIESHFIVEMIVFATLRALYHKK